MVDPTQGPNQNNQSFLDTILTKLKDPIVWGGILVIIILIVVAVMMIHKQNNTVGTFTDTATKYLLTNTPNFNGTF